MGKSNGEGGLRLEIDVLKQTTAIVLFVVTQVPAAD